MLDASCWMELAKARSLRFLNACMLALVVLYPNLAGEVNRETAGDAKPQAAGRLVMGRCNG